MISINLPYSIGQEVEIGDKVKAVILGVAIYSESYFQYQCAWWQDGIRRVGWLQSEEVKSLDKTKQMKIGFQPPYSDAISITP